MMPFLDVRDFGAASNGLTVADDTVAVQAALDEAGFGANRGSTVWLPHEHGISAPLRIPSFVRVSGAGRGWHTGEITNGDPPGYYGGGLVALPPLDFHMLVNADQVNGNTGIEIDHLRIDQRGVTGDRDVMNFKGLWRSKFHSFSIVGSTQTINKRGIHVLSGEENHVIGNRFDGCGIRYHGNSLTARNNDIGAFGVYGIEFLNGFGHRISENHIYNAAREGIFGYNLIGCTIVNNHVEDCGYHGMYFANGLVYSVVQGNVAKQNSRTNPGLRNGISIDSDTAGKASHHNTITGNVCIDTQATPTQGYGIALLSYSGTQTKDNVVAHNVLFGNTKAGFFQKAGMPNIVRDSIGYTEPPRTISGSVTLS